MKGTYSSSISSTRRLASLFPFEVLRFANVLVFVLVDSRYDGDVGGGGGITPDLSNLRVDNPFAFPIPYPCPCPCAYLLDEVEYKEPRIGIEAVLGRQGDPRKTDLETGIVRGRTIFGNFFFFFET